jgi:uncharacterized membrane protein YheB (UPF0754 family)
MKRIALFVTVLFFLTTSFTQSNQSKSLNQINEICNSIAEKNVQVVSRDTVAKKFNYTISKKDIKQLKKQVKCLTQSLDKLKTENTNDSVFVSKSDLCDNIENHLGHMYDHQSKLIENFNAFKSDLGNDDLYLNVVFKYGDLSNRAEKINELIQEFKK